MLDVRTPGRAAGRQSRHRRRCRLREGTMASSPEAATAPRAAAPAATPTVLLLRILRRLAGAMPLILLWVTAGRLFGPSARRTMMWTPVVLLPPRGWCADAFRPMPTTGGSLQRAAVRRVADRGTSFMPPVGARRTTTSGAEVAVARVAPSTRLSLALIPQVRERRKKRQDRGQQGRRDEEADVDLRAPSVDDEVGDYGESDGEAGRLAVADRSPQLGEATTSDVGAGAIKDVPAAGAVFAAATVSTDSSAGNNNNNNNSSNEGLGIWAARGVLLLVAAIWGTNFASVKYLEGLCFHPPCHHPASEFAFARFGVAALVSLPLLWRQNARVILAGFECGLTIALGYISQAMALETIPSGECAFICSLTVVVVPLAASLLYGKPLEVRHLAAAAVALLGVGILEGLVDVTSWFSLDAAGATATTNIITAASTSAMAAAADAATTVAESAPAAATTTALNTVAHSYGPLDAVAKALHVETGDLLALGQPLGFGYSFLRIEHYQEQFKAVPNRVLTIAAAQCVCVGLLSALWMLSDYSFVVPSFGYLVEPHRIAVILWTGIVTTLLAIYLEGFALQTASATDASIAFSSEPVWASLFGFWLLREQLGIESYVGGTVIMAACLIGTLSDLKEKEPDEVAANGAVVPEPRLFDVDALSSAEEGGIDDPTHSR